MKKAIKDMFSQKKYVLGISMWLAGTGIFIFMTANNLIATFTEYALFAGGMFTAITAASVIDKKIQDNNIPAEISQK